MTLTLPVSQKNSQWQNVENTILSSRFATFDNRLRHKLRLHCLDIAMIKFLDESGSIDYCVCTVLVSCTVRHSFEVKRYVCAFWIKKDM